MNLYQDEFESPVGMIYIVSDGTKLRALDFEGHESRLHRLLAIHYGRYTIHSTRDTIGTMSRLKDYFDGDLQAGERLAMATNGTEFQQQVWAALRTIPAGTTVSYGMIANRIGRPNACRAVGLANGSNPIGIFVPCHRVIGANKSLTGYGGGLARKQWLLEHEGALTATCPQSSLFRESPQALERNVPAFPMR
ncbi:methylated-DNA--[protein]-cysteine S-methyltransferase [Schlesneria paludicola]|uniref:methylated-DNA--[protein]-cysteine S-methyltransferase n=1 Tax=Schlesneria paludicola TaxID=360056 RepID=UPI00029A79DF|nr:methylated-DNA--[protein]-cysteine S-methyltransferase [Schlesneria paludicola]